MSTDRELLAKAITALIMEHLPPEVDLRLREWYKLSAWFFFGSDGNIHVDNPRLVSQDALEKARDPHLTQEQRDIIYGRKMGTWEEEDIIYGRKMGTWEEE
jgi:hypothetical protein